MTARVPLRRRWGLTRSLTVSITACLSAFLILAFLGAYWLVENQSYRTLDLTLIRASNVLVLQDQRGDPIDRNLDCQWLSAAACAQAVGTGYPGPPVLPLPEDSEPVRSGAGAPVFSTATVQGHPMRLYTAPLSGGKGVVTVGYRADGIELSLERTRWLLLAVGVVGVGLSALSGYLLARANLRDLNRVRRVAEELTREQMSTGRIGMPGDDELARLSATFDQMVDTLQDAVRAQKQLVADASHELRTPLTAIRANAELALDGALAPERRLRAGRNLRGAVDDMTGLVSDIVDLARGDEPLSFPEELRLDEVLAEATRSVQGAWPERTFGFSADPAIITGDHERLFKLFANLISNAAKYSPREEPVDVSLRVKGRSATVSVRDHGPGVDEAERERIFDRFYRTPSARAVPGSGLGLAVAQQIAVEHGTAVRGSWPATGGTLMSVSFPAEGPGTEGSSTSG